jgi:hypothetical protein
MPEGRRREVAAEAHRIALALDELGGLDEKIVEAVRPVVEEYLEKVGEVTERLVTLIEDCHVERAHGGELPALGAGLHGRLDTALSGLRGLPDADGVLHSIKGSPDAEGVDVTVRKASHQLEEVWETA